MDITKLRHFLFGKPRDPFDPKTRQHIALIAFFAWVGLGADGLSSSCYGPEEAYLALGAHTQLGLYLVLAIVITVFVISFSYNQVVELFPNGGGGYKVSTALLGPYAGLVCGAALIVDYILTISISVASGIDAIFSLLPSTVHPFKVAIQMGMVLLLMALNLRGMKEAIKFLLPVFVGFIVIHICLIVYGILSHGRQLGILLPSTLMETKMLSDQLGWAGVFAALMLAYSLGGGTYTGLEAVSNNVHTLAEPRVQTGKWTMFYMAVSLAFVAGGVLLLYMLWDVVKLPGQTLNAVTFDAVIRSIGLKSDWLNNVLLLIVLALEGGLLFVAANTGFLGGPAVLSNMAADSWVPRQFRELSSRLVTQNGIVVMGISALFVLLWSAGNVALLVVLYSINVFLTFSISLMGLCVFWVKHKKQNPHWLPRFLLSFTGFLVTSSILLVLVVEKFMHGGWATIAITLLVISMCLVIRKHYQETQEQLSKVDQLFIQQVEEISPINLPHLDHKAPTAIFFVGKNLGVGMHTLLWVQRLFPNHFKNFIFLSVGEVDTQSYGGQDTLESLQTNIQDTLQYFLRFCHQNGLAATVHQGFGTDPVEELMKMTVKVLEEFPQTVCFASKLVFIHDNFVTRWLHNQTAYAMQRRLHLLGKQMVILPMKL